MTLQEILVKYNELRENARKFANWRDLDSFIEELAQLASGTPMVVPFSDGSHPEIRL